MESKFPFSKERLLALPLPASGRATYHDTKIQGLQLRVTPTGTKTFCVYRRLKAGQPERVTLGKFPTMTVEQARKAATAINSEIESGANPAEVKRIHKGVPTFQEVFDEYLERKRKRDGNPIGERTKAEYINTVRLYLKDIAGQKLSAITHERTASAIHRASKAAPIAANRALAVTRAVFNYAIRKRMFSGVNPAVGIEANPERSRDRFLQPDELPRFFAAVAEEEPVMRDFILLALLTGARRANVCAMHWRELQLAEGVWRIPKTKNGTAQNVTLCPEAIQILESRKATTAGGFVFPSHGKTGHIVEPKKAVMRVMERAGIPYGRDVDNGVTLHDLRRTLGSWQARTGASLAIIGKSLNHKSPQATAIYARLDLDPVRQSVNTATAAMLEAGGLKDAADVVTLPGKRGAA